jgi:hypothetical protein
VSRYKDTSGPYGVEVERAEILKLETPDHVLDHIYSHFKKEYKHVLTDPSQFKRKTPLPSPPKRKDQNIMEGVGNTWSGDKLSTYLNPHPPAEEGS